MTQDDRIAVLSSELLEEVARLKENHIVAQKTFKEHNCHYHLLVAKCEAGHDQARLGFVAPLNKDELN